MPRSPGRPSMRPPLAGTPGLLLAFAHRAAAESPQGIDQHIAQGFKPFADAVAGFVFAAIHVGGFAVPWILFWLITAGIFCTLYFRFINLRGMAQGMRIIRGDYA